MADGRVVDRVAPPNPEAFVEGEASTEGMALRHLPVGSKGDSEEQRLARSLRRILGERRHTPEADSQERLQVAPAEILLAGHRYAYVLETERGQVRVEAPVTPAELE